MERGHLKSILRSDQTVFTTRDLHLLWRDATPAAVRKRISYFLESGDLYPIRRGLYAKDNRYNRLEMATRIYTPAYISFETVLGSAGVTFQHYSQIFVASPTTKDIEADGQKISFLTLKSSILTNLLGIEIKSNFALATVERALLDRIYISRNYHFDNLDLINWEKVEILLPVYEGNKEMKKRVDTLKAIRNL